MSKSRKNSRSADSILLVCEGEDRRVELQAPKPVRIGGRWMVRLMDLWVASLLPHTFLDVGFEMITSDASGAIRLMGPIDALQFARGFVALKGRVLWWEDPLEGALNGLCLRAIVARLHPEARPDVVPSHPLGARASTLAPLVDLRRLLPELAEAYPVVEWRQTDRLTG